MSKVERIVEYIDKLMQDYNKGEYEAIQLHNDYCDNAGCTDERIYAMEEFSEIFASEDKFELVRMVCYGNFTPSDEFFVINAYGNLDSSSFALDLINSEDIADYCVENDDDLNNEVIRSILDEGVSE